MLPTARSGEGRDEKNNVATVGRKPSRPPKNNTQSGLANMATVGRKPSPQKQQKNKTKEQQTKHTIIAQAGLAKNNWLAACGKQKTAVHSEEGYLSPPGS